MYKSWLLNCRLVVLLDYSNIEKKSLILNIKIVLITIISAFISTVWIVAKWVFLQFYKTKLLLKKIEITAVKIKFQLYLMLLIFICTFVVNVNRCFISGVTGLFTRASFYNNVSLRVSLSVNNILSVVYAEVLTR